MDKAQGPDGRKYIINHGKRFLIPDSITRNALGLKVDDFTQKTQEELDILQDGRSLVDIKNVRLIKSISNPTDVFAVLPFPELHKRHVPNPLTFNALGLSWEKIEGITQSEFDAIPTQPALVSFENWETDVQDAVKELLPKSGPKKAVIKFGVFGPIIKRTQIKDYLSYGDITADGIKDEFTHTSFQLGEFFQRQVTDLTVEILDRYVEATTIETHQGIVSAHPEISKYLVDPLVSAKRNFCLGDYLSCIAVCGVVGEMLAIFLWKTSSVTFKNHPITEEEEALLFQRTFERLMHERRLGVLKAFNRIPPEQQKKFSDIQGVRRSYLHFWARKPRNEKADALLVFRSAMSLFKQIVGVKLHDAGSIDLPPALQKYLVDNSAKLVPNDKKNWSE
ncbi:MAG: hypothetical protein WCV85_05080 [Patescibacteria group bacterium]|jgi:hypothetical protein